MSRTLKEIDSMISFIDTELESSDTAQTTQTTQKTQKTQKKQKRKKTEQHEVKSDMKQSEQQPREPGTLPNPTHLDIDERVERAFSVGAECVTKDELRQLLLKKKTRPIAYDGFEPSGRMHIAQGILKSICVNKLTDSGIDFVFWIADWFGLLNNKMGGDLKKIRVVGEYMIETWKASGMNMDHVYFKWASDEINENSNEYWLRVIEISKNFSINRTKRCCTIMGRTESDDMGTNNLMYVCMQCSDIFFLKADICQLGLDQRKVNMLAREYAKSKKLHPPVVISHPMLMGLLEGQEKMSKSSPDSAIFMEDAASDVKRKIKKAYCPPGIVEGNPCLNWTQHIIFGKLDKFEIKRKEENGGNTTYDTYQQLEDDFRDGLLHPGDLKPALWIAINEMLEPVRKHFATDKRAKELLKKVKQYRVTR